MSKTVIALGGNALGDTAEEQLRLVRNTAVSVAKLARRGDGLAIVHGNGPQVGMINMGLEAAAEAGAIKASMPFPECGAMSQGYIGYHLQNSIDNELSAGGIQTSAVCLVTQVLVSESDPAFSHPTKPIGRFYSKEEAEKISREKGYVMAEDAGRGFRRVVPSPKPIDIIEKDTAEALLSSGKIVIAAGGGGVPVIRKKGRLVGVDAVIDKDLAAAKLAELIKADTLIILTAVDKVALNYGRPNCMELDKMTIAEAEKYIEEGHFAPGSMLPKVLACIEFARSGGRAIIASLKNAEEALNGEGGTLILS